MIAVSFRTSRFVRAHVFFAGHLPLGVASKLAEAAGKDMMVCDFTLFVAVPFRDGTVVWHRTTWIWHYERHCFLDLEGQERQP